MFFHLNGKKLASFLFTKRGQTDVAKRPSCQSGFKPGDSCINQLLSITHEIYSSFDEGLEVRSVFLDISKAFGKVWHDGIIFNLTQNGISGNLLNLLRDF